jgi:uncharacterized membrane protein YfbV (UPF0208 family)
VVLGVLAALAVLVALVVLGVLAALAVLVALVAILLPLSQLILVLKENTKKEILLNMKV